MLAITTTITLALLLVILVLLRRHRRTARLHAIEREERALLESVLDNVPGTLYLFDEGGRYLRWNQPFLEASGYTADELSRLSPLDFFRGDDIQRVTERIAEVMAVGESSVEARLVAKDGHSTPYFFTGRRISYRGRPALVGMGLDITARVRMETKLRESEERFRQLTETIDEVFWISDPVAQRALYASPAFEAIWGRPSSALYDDPSLWINSVHAEDRAAVAEATPRQLTGDYDMTYRIVRPDGTIRWVRDRAYPVRDAAGVPHRIVGLAEDVTERKAIEAQFLRAQRMESIGTLAGGIAHDLNNVLTPILMSVEMLRMEDDTAERRETLDNIEATARKGADMIRQVLQFARGVDGRRVEIDVRELVDDVVRIGNDTFLKAVQLTAHIDRDLPPVSGDPTQLHQVLLNLAVNARDAMPDGGTITITARSEDLLRPEADVLVEVTDTGTGIPPELVDRIFEPFFTTKAQGKGTGLGLSTSLAIVTSHGGTLRVRSTPGKGTTFTMRLPTMEGARPATSARSAGCAQRGNGEMILVVDDEAAIRSVTARLLQAHGYGVMLASDGREAVECYAEHRASIAVVLTDMMMPVMDGATAIARLRAIDPGVRLITVSGLADQSGLPPTGPDQYPIRHLAKPYTAGELIAVIGQALRGDA
ncbi:MAG TPA: PAS domain S-box protein [Gemmatimonadales bacterium]|nr:PAS domain S-box protein [Gemmatimonadales bacterium]